jgi:hypothetical protein
MFYAEAEGKLPTKAGKINAVINYINEHYSNATIEFSDFEQILHEHGLTYEELSPREKRYIDASIR